MTFPESRTAWLLARARGRWTAAVSNARITAAYRRATAGMMAIVTNSGVSRLGGWMRGALRGSLLYGWLTTEPEPQVVEIDLRETRTIGPVLTVLDWVGATLSPWWDAAATNDLADDFAAGFESQPIRALSFVALGVVVSNLVGRVALGSLGRTGLGIGLVGLGLALAGTRVRSSLDELAETRAWRLFATILVPPNPPNSDENRD